MQGVSAKEMKGVHSGKFCEKHPGVEKALWHKDPRRSGGGLWVCSACTLVRSRRYRAAFPERQREAYVKFERKVVLVGDQQVTKGRARRWWHKYGLRPQDVYEMWEKQGRRCVFGGEPLAWDDIYIDHQHDYPGCKKNKAGPHGCPKESVRGLSCDEHNILEGRYAADPEGYMAVAKWHVKHNGGNWEDICS